MSLLILAQKGENVDVLNCIRTRRSIRNYLDIPIDKDRIGRILNAGRLAPSAGNIQNMKFIVVEDQKKRNELAEASMQQYWMSGAPVHIIVCSERGKSKSFYGERGEKMYSLLNSGAAIQNMLLEAHNVDLGACWVSGFDDTKIKRILGIPGDCHPDAIVTIGYPAEVPSQPEKYKLVDFAYFEKWGTGLKDVNLAQFDVAASFEKKLVAGAHKVKSRADKVLDKVREKLKVFE